MDAKTPTLSVIVPVYKSEPYLRQCIESILGQTFSDFELILVDDGSPDGSGAICDEYARTDTRVQVIHKENGGVSTARNSGLARARGSYVCFVDSDDTIDREYFREAVAQAREHRVDVHISGLIEIGYGGDPDRREAFGICVPQLWSVAELWEELDRKYPQICICGPWCKLYSRSLLERSEASFPEDMNCGEDTVFNLKVLERCQTIYFSDRCYYHYYNRGSDSLFRRVHLDAYEMCTRVYDKMRELMVASGCSEEALDRFDAMYFDRMLAAISEYYVKKDTATGPMRLGQIRKVIHNPIVRNIALSTIRSPKKKILFVLIKCRQARILHLLYVKMAHWDTVGQG